MSEQEQLTIEQLNEMPSHTIIATGITKNSPGGIYMTDSNKDHFMRWVAKRGEINDWAIYIHWANHDEKFVMELGDKVRDEKNIKKLVPCTDEAFEKYRY